MNKSFIYAIGLITGLAGLAAPSFATDAPSSQSAAETGCCGKMGSGMCQHRGPGMGKSMRGDMCQHKGAMRSHDKSWMHQSSRHMHMILSLDLSDDQRKRINQLSDELKQKNLATKSKIMDVSSKLRDLYAADKRNPSAIGKEYQKIFDLKRKMIEATITTQNRIEETLTPEQRDQLKGMCPMEDGNVH